MTVPTIEIARCSIRIRVVLGSRDRREQGCNAFLSARSKSTGRATSINITGRTGRVRRRVATTLTPWWGTVTSTTRRQLSEPFSGRRRRLSAMRANFLLNGQQVDLRLCNDRRRARCAEDWATRKSALGLRYLKAVLAPRDGLSATATWRRFSTCIRNRRTGGDGEQGRCLTPWSCHSALPCTGASGDSISLRARQPPPRTALCSTGCAAVDTYSSTPC